MWHHNTLCWWHHTQPMCDILCTADDITSTLSHHTPVFMMSHPLQAWHHNPCIRHCTRCIFVPTTSPLIAHKLLNDITPTFCVTSYALYRTSHPILMSSHYCTYDITTSLWNHIQYVGQHIHFTCDITATLYDITPLYDIHTHCIHVITPRIPVITSTVAELLLTVYWL